MLFAFPKPISCPPCIPELFPRKKNKLPNKHYRQIYDNTCCDLFTKFISIHFIPRDWLFVFPLLVIVEEVPKLGLIFPALLLEGWVGDNN